MNDTVFCNWPGSLFMIRSFRIMVALGWMAVPLSAQIINISGRVTDTSGSPISGALVELEKGGQKTTTGTDGRFSLRDGITNIGGHNNQALPQMLIAAMREGILSINVTGRSDVTITAFSPQGKLLWAGRLIMQAGTHSVALPCNGSGVSFCNVKSGNHMVVLKDCSVETVSRGTALSGKGPGSSAALAKRAKVTEVINDTLTVTKTGYLDYRMPIRNSDTSGIEITLADTLPLFSFFVTSLKALQELSGSQNGFGGDLRFGKTGTGAGLKGADSICECIAEKSMPGSSVKVWRAFLSVSSDENGRQVNAIDRIGEGPWYDRVGRLLAPTLADLLNTRPQNGDPAIQNDLPNENGIPNHYPDPNGPAEDNHHFITGSGTDGKLYSAASNCDNWTSVSAGGRPRCGFAWPREGGGGGFGDAANWISGIDAASCKAGVQVTTQNTGDHIGSAGGYGGFYCFALKP
jgi:hypothetical protein